MMCMRKTNKSCYTISMLYVMWCQNENPQITSVHPCVCQPFLMICSVYALINNTMIPDTFENYVTCVHFCSLTAHDSGHAVFRINFVKKRVVDYFSTSITPTGISINTATHGTRVFCLNFDINECHYPESFLQTESKSILVHRLISLLNRQSV